MANPSKAKGTRFETLIADYLRVYFPHVERRPLQGTADCGDISGIHDLVVQCKNQQSMSLGAWLDSAHAQADVADVTFGIVAHNRRGRGQAADQFITMSVADFARMYHLLLQLEHDVIARDAQ